MILKAEEPGRWAAFNAIRHLNRAWMLREIDPMMAAFRAMTGEEEAATALFHALRRLKYPAARRLDPANHLHKNAVTPFLAAVWDLLRPAWHQTFPGGFTLTINKDEPKPRLIVSGRDKDGGWYTPIPPLHLYVTEGQIRSDGTLDPASEKPVDFERKIAEHAAKAGAASILGYLQKRAILRSQLLYAGDKGIPTLGTPIEVVLRRFRASIFKIVKLYLLVDGYNEVQSFARQCLLSFLRIVENPKIQVKFE
jgi:hypothetical protein